MAERSVNFPKIGTFALILQNNLNGIAGVKRLENVVLTIIIMVLPEQMVVLTTRRRAVAGVLHNSF